MPHAFDGRSFGQFLLEAERLLSGVRDHEQRLTSLLAILESETSQTGVGTIPIAESGMDVLGMVGRLRADAGEHRQLAETLLNRLVGLPPIGNGVLSTRVRVLVVDDSESSREMTATILEEAGFEAMTATNGLEGVIVAHYARPSVVLMDLTMPVLDGLEAARLIQASADTRHVKVIAYTAKPDAHGAPFARWFADILRKPAAPDAIVAAVERFGGASLQRAALS
jgi:CheY-like chemotaxis protein